MIFDRVRTPSSSSQPVRREHPWKFHIERIKAIGGTSFGIGSALGLGLAAAANGGYWFASVMFIVGAGGGFASIEELKNVYEEHNQKKEMKPLGMP